MFIEPAPGSKQDGGGNLIQGPISQRSIISTDLITPGSKRGAGGEITQGPTLYKLRYQENPVITTE